MKKMWKSFAKYFVSFGITITTLFSSILYAQSEDLLKSIPIYGKAPASVIPTVTLNGPTPLEVIGNPFSQPNIQDYLGRKHLDWYGSGDVNNDEKIDSLDVAAIDTAKNDRADIDGDGVSGTQNDKQILINYLNGKIPYLPGHWDELTTRDERVSWLEKMIKIDSLDTQVLNLRQNYGWVCGDISTQEQINFYGISNIDEFIKNNKTTGGTDFFKDHNARFDIPVYQISTINKSGLAHSINGILVGNNPLIFEDWYKFSDFAGRDDINILPGDAQMKDGPVSISLEAYVQDPDFKNDYFGFIGDIVKFNLVIGIPSLEQYKPYLTLNNSNVIKVHVGNLEKIVVDSGKFPDGTVLTPEFLQSHGYKAIPDTSKENTTLSINLSYFDSDSVKLSNTHYTFSRKFYAWIYSGGITKLDSTTQQIEVDKVTSVEEDGDKIPQEFVLYQNYPNPFNPSTTIKFSVPSVGRNGISTYKVLLKVYDLLGREVATLVNEEKAPGNYEVKFDATSAKGGLSSGVYFYRLQTGSFVETKKLILVK